MSGQDRSREQDQGLFAPDQPQTVRRGADELMPQRRQGENWPAYYRDYFLRRPMFLLIVFGLGLEVQPLETIQPTYFIAHKLVNREEIVLEGTEDEEAHKEGVKADTLAKVETAKAEVLAKIEYAKECQKTREIAGNSAYLQCAQSGKTAGYCRFVYQQAKTLDCPEIPTIPNFEE